MSHNQFLRILTVVLLAGLFPLFFEDMSFAVDTDIYQANVKQNAYILLDNSGSMDFGVYESSINYADMFEYLYAKSEIDDTIANPSTAFHNNHHERNKVFLVKGKIGVSIININNQDRAFTGDAADPDYLWYSHDMIDLHAFIDSTGNMTTEAGHAARLTTDAEGHVLLDGVRLPLGQDRLLHDMATLYDGSTVDEGVGGLLTAPGYYFSGLKGVGDEAADHKVAEDGDEYVYFFVTGNWMNMQQMYNLHYISNPPGAASTGEMAWRYETFPLSGDGWSVTGHVVDYPDGSGNYANNLSEADTLITITHPGATQIQVHFSMFDVEGDGKTSKFGYDYVALYDAGGSLVAKYDNDNSPQGSWSPVISGDTVRVALRSDQGVVKAGYTIDQYRTTYLTDSYLMQNRLDVAKDALLYVVDEFRGKINWGFASFAYQGSSGNGATIHCALNPTENDDTNRQAIAQKVENVDPKYGTPLGEALQDVFEDGYYGHRNSLDNLDCRKNYIIVVSDGFPSADEDWSRIGGKTFTDEDGDGFTADPYQYSNPPANYYDDVAHWIYTHSWLDKSEVTDPAGSYENIIPHQIAFGADHPLMQNAAEESGAEYITAYNKTQLVNAFYSLGLMISEAVSFTAPVVSVDAANKVQNGDDLYMGQFLPMDSTYWPGNVKKFVLGDGSTTRPDNWMIYDAADNEAIDSSGLFLDNTAAFWGDDNDSNDSDNYGAPDIQEDGAGEVLTERIVGDFNNGNYYERNIKTYVSGSLVSFDRTTITPATLGLDAADTVARDKIVNWAYGYTFDADAVSGDPVAARDWALGAIVHSRPTVIDYYNSTDFSQIDKRYVVVGADDGMLHVFDDTDGSEVLAFVPADVLTKLRHFETVLHQPLVDGSIKLYRENGNPKYLIFGLRRGGANFWALNVSDQNPANWTVAWVFSDGEMVQSWSEVQITKIRTGANQFTSVAVISGGYDPVEDNFPEPFEDLDNNGTPYASNGHIDNQEWASNDNDQDVYNNNQYDMQNPAGDSHGRAIYVLNVSDGSVVFSVKHGDEDNPATPGEESSVTAQTRTDFTYCFPSSPSVVSVSQYYSDIGVRQSNVLAAIYAPDIYGNLFRISYDYGDGSPTWQVRHLFSANPGSASASGTLGGGDNVDDGGRKVFYGPTVSWKGAGRYFDPSNYYYPNTEFYDTNVIASLYFGTGDREHPSYQMVQDRVYAVYDDTPVSADNSVDISSAPYSEDDLLNLTCDEMDSGTGQAGMTAAETALYKTGLDALLTDDVINASRADPMELASGGHGENDAKGWYVVLAKQGLASYCSHCQYEAAVSTGEGERDYHVGEKVLGKLALYAGNLYFTTYQPSFDDPCNPQGNAFIYAVDYLDASAALNYNTANDSSGDDKDVSDRYCTISGIKGLPSGFEIVTRDGEAGALANAGGKILGGEIPGADSGISLYYWIERD